MSFGSTCPACAMGDHERHDYGYGLREGLIGGQHCGCTGDCAERWAEEVEKIREALCMPDLDVVLDSRMAPGTFMLGSREHGVRMWDTQATDPLADLLAARKAAEEDAGWRIEPDERLEITVERPEDLPETDGEMHDLLTKIGSIFGADPRDLVIEDSNGLICLPRELNRCSVTEGVHHWALDGGPGIVCAACLTSVYPREAPAPPEPLGARRLTITLRVKPHGRAYRALTYPLGGTLDKAKAERSRWMYVQSAGYYHTSPLGILHSLIGLTLYVEED